MAEKLKVKLRVEYEFEVDTDDFELEADDGTLYKPGTAGEMCQVVHGLISEDPRGVQDIIEDDSTRRVALVVSPA